MVLESLNPSSSLLGAQDVQILTANSYIRRVALTAGVGSLLFGLDTGLISAALVSLRDDFGKPLTTGQEELVVSATTVGALCGSLIAGLLADRLGRKRVILVASVFFLLGAIEQSAANVVSMLVLGRLIVGLAVGLASMVLPIYIAEIVPAVLRGRLVTSLIVLITGGQVLAFAIGATLFNVSSGWRWMLGSGAVPAGIQLLLGFSIPETPRWLIHAGDYNQARLVLHKVYPESGAQEIEDEIQRIEAALTEHAQQQPANIVSRWQSFLDLMWRDVATRKALIVSCGLQALQQLCGFNSLMYYSSHIMRSIGFGQPAAWAICIALSNFVCTIIVCQLIDRIGRRRVLLRTILGMILSLVCLSFFYLFVPAEDSTKRGPNAASFLVLLSMIAFCCSYAAGLGNVPWLVQSEIFSYQTRSIAGSIATTTNWTANLVVAATFLHLIQLVGGTFTFALYALVCVVAWVFVNARLPETAGLTIEECRKLFENDSTPRNKTAQTSSYDAINTNETGQDL